jgi:hypothetical protein
MRKPLSPTFAARSSALCGAGVEVRVRVRVRVRG